MFSEYGREACVRTTLVSEENDGKVAVVVYRGLVSGNAFVPEPVLRTTYDTNTGEIKDGDADLLNEREIRALARDAQAAIEARNHR